MDLGAEAQNFAEYPPPFPPGGVTPTQPLVFKKN